MTYWTACYTAPGAERKAREGIERIGFGTFLPTFAKSWYRDGKLCAREVPLIGRYLFIALDDGDDSWGQINDVDGAQRVLSANGVPIRISGTDMTSLMIAHASGAYNVIQARDAAGRYIQKNKSRKPRTLSARSRRANRRRRERERKRVDLPSNHTRMTAAAALGSLGQ